MNLHKNARLTPLRREEMAVEVLDSRLSKAQAAKLYDVSLKIVSRWTERFRTSRRGYDRPLVARRQQSPSNGRGHCRTDTSSSQTTPDRQAHDRCSNRVNIPAFSPWLYKQRNAAAHQTRRLLEN